MNSLAAVLLDCFVFLVWFLVKRVCFDTHELFTNVSCDTLP